MKLILFFISLSLVGAVLLVVPYTYSSSSSSFNEAGAFANTGDDIVTFSFITGLLKGLGGGGGGGGDAGGSLEATTANPQTPPPSPHSDRISVPDFSTCRPGIFPYRIIPVNCCPPVNTSPAVDFTVLPKSRNLRVRRALHLLDDEYMAKFSRAVQLMRELPDDDPRSFSQQTKIHCAYCGGAHAHSEFPETLLDVHFSWHFFPWHRMYIYFFERILGKLIDDPSFALPYWNWDSTESMQIPESFAFDKSSPFYEELRNKKHMPPATLDLNYDKMTDSTASEQERKMNNLAMIYRQVVSAGRTPELFHGKPTHPWDPPRSGMGSFEEHPHGIVHFWIGDVNQPNREAMGTAYLAPRDPLFFVHHCNVDRIWTIWKTLLPGGNRTDITDPDWLNSEFMFYDEEARLVKIKVKDCLDTAKQLGYTYEDAGVAPPWVNARPTPRGGQKKTKTKETISTTNIMFPIKLDEVMRFVVPRSVNNNNNTNNNNKEEVLVIQGIKVDGNDKRILKFDVIINDEGNGDGIGPSNTEFAGSYWSEPSRSDDDKHGEWEDSLTLGGISELLEDLGAQHDESVGVTLVPRFKPRAETSLTIGGIKFDFA